MKILFLPHCLKEGYIKQLKKEGEKNNYDVCVVGGGSAVKKYLNKYDGLIKKVIGIACDDEIKLAMDYTKF